MDNDIDTYYKLIECSTFPVTIQVKNSYERLCVYAAMEKYEREHDILLIKRRVHEWIDLTSNCIRCLKHWLSAYGGCTECDDAYCTGPMCKKRCDIRDGDKFVDPNLKPKYKTKVITAIIINFKWILN